MSVRETAYRLARSLLVEAVSEEVERCGDKAHEHVAAIAERVAVRLLGPVPEEKPHAE